MQKERTPVTGEPAAGTVQNEKSKAELTGVAGTDEKPETGKAGLAGAGLAERPGAGAAEKPENGLDENTEAGTDDAPALSFREALLRLCRMHLAEDLLEAAVNFRPKPGERDETDGAYFIRYFLSADAKKIGSGQEIMREKYRAELHNAKRAVWVLATDEDFVRILKILRADCADIRDNRDRYNETMRRADPAPWYSRTKKARDGERSRYDEAERYSAVEEELTAGLREKLEAVADVLLQSVLEK